jgi:hypothetical protein
MKTRDVPASGKRARGEKGMTAARRRQRRNMGELAQSWDELEQWERDEWWNEARCMRIRVRRKANSGNPKKLCSRPMRGEELYVKINRVLEVCGYLSADVPLLKLSAL